MSKRKTFINGFKTMILELILSGEEGKDEGITTNLEEINRMRNENARLEEENQILKSHGYIRKEINPDILIEIIKVNSGIHNIDTICRVLK